MNSIVRSQADIGAGANAVQLPELCPKKLCDFNYAVASPLHCANDDDRGRNEKLIRFEGRENEASRLVGSINLQGKQRGFQDRLEQNFGPYYSRRLLTKGHPSGMAESRAI